MLYNFARIAWSGQDDVLEMGPFLGGTTRALALGMRDNPHRDTSCRLVTCDRFDSYFSNEELRSILEPLVISGVLTQSQLDALQNSTDFSAVFEEIHGNEQYAGFLSIVNAQLPMLPNQSVHGPADFTPGERPLGLIFVDGCKSWFAMKYFMTRVAPVAPKGSFFLFQDYGMYTCFWIPAFVALNPEHFRLVAFVDATYVFRLIKQLDVDALERFPDEPGRLGESHLDSLYEPLVEEAGARRDSRGFVTASLQHAAAVAYLGQLERARSMIDALGADQRCRGFEYMVRAAREVPTYVPLTEGGGEDPQWLGGKPIRL